MHGTGLIRFDGQPVRCRSLRQIEEKACAAVRASAVQGTGGHAPTIWMNMKTAPHCQIEGRYACRAIEGDSQR